MLLFTIFILRACCPILLFCARHPFAPQSLRLKQKKLPPTSTFQPWPNLQALPWYFLRLWRTGQYKFPSSYFYFHFFTWADDTNILIESTVVLAPAGVPAAPKVGFSSSTLHIIQMDNFPTGAIVRQSQDRDSLATVKLSAHNVGTPHIEIIITDCAPFSIMINFNPPGASVPSSFQSQLWWS